MTSKSSLTVRRALSDSVPIVLGYVPMGAAYGILARQAGIGLFPSVAMSLVVFAGASQFIAVGLLSGGATAAEVIGTTFFVNLRHTLMSASLSPYFAKAPRRALPFVAWGITDETYALSIGRHAAGEADLKYSLALHYAAFAAWVGGSAAGAAAGALVPPALQAGLSFSLYSMFVGLVVLRIEGWRHVVVAAIAVAVSVLLWGRVPGTWHVILAAVVAATVGLLLEGKGKRTRAS